MKMKVAEGQDAVAVLRRLGHRLDREGFRREMWRHLFHQTRSERRRARQARRRRRG